MTPQGASAAAAKLALQALAAQPITIVTPPPGARAQEMIARALPHLSPSAMAVTMTGEPGNGANVASGVNVNGAARNGVSTSGTSIVIGASIETMPESATSEKSNLRVPSNES